MFCAIPSAVYFKILLTIPKVWQKTLLASPSEIAVTINLEIFWTIILLVASTIRSAHASEIISAISLLIYSATI